MNEARLLKQYRRMMMFFIIVLVLSGATAVPIDRELALLLGFIPPGTAVYAWIEKVLQAWNVVSANSPFLLYGYDWLAFAHFIIAIFFIGPYRDPVKNIWVIQAGIIACVLIFPMALIAGHFRGIPLGWQLLDCSFGLIGALPLLYCYRITKQLEKIHQQLNQKNGNDYSDRMVQRQIAG